MQIKREETCINASVATGQARPRNSDITPSIEENVMAHLRGKHYRVVRSADMMLRTSKKSKKRAPRGSKANLTQDQYNTGRRKSQYEYQRKTYSRADRRKARQI